MRPSPQGDGAGSWSRWYRHPRRMKSARLCAVTALASIVLVLGCPPIAPGGTVAGPTPGPAVDLGSVLSLGFGVSPLGVQLPAPPVGVGGPERDGGPSTALEVEGKALSFDVRLRWPGADEAGPLEPYLSFGPALFLVEPDYAGLLLGTRTNPSVHVGAKAGAGLNWRLGRGITLFGAYEITTAADAGLSAGGRAPSSSGADGYDFTYGIRFRF
jgi:hypothetical protein